jgi:hypothetical protein
VIEFVVSMQHVIMGGCLHVSKRQALVKLACLFLAWEDEKWGGIHSDFSELD